MATQKRFIAKNGLDNNTQTITNVADPVNSQDAATKNYVSSNFAGASSSAYPTVSPSLNLDFIGTRQLDSRITFTRNSIATYYDGQTTAMAEQNLLIGSQTIGGTGWILGSNIAALNSTTAPDGTTTASSITENATVNSHFIGSAGIIVTAGLPYTFSVYLKKGVGATAPQYMQFYAFSAAFNCGINVDLNAGTVYSTISTEATVTSSSSVAMGNGWYRFIFTATALFSLTSANIPAVVFINNNPASGAAPSYLGLVTSDVQAWGAQLEQRSSVTAYTPTTTVPITNYIPVLMTAPTGVARFDYDPITGKSLGLLIEESRVNLATYSSDFSNAAWTKNNAAITTAADVSPDGTLTANLFVPSSGTFFNSTSRLLRNIGGGSVGVTDTVSIYVKYAGRQWVYLSAPEGTSSNDDCWFDILNGVVGTVRSLALNPTITAVGNGWYKVSVSSLNTSTSRYLYLSSVDANTSAAVTGNGYSGIYIWGAQLEAGAFATSYIPTVASTVTRAADVTSMTGTNFSSWYNQSQGSFLYIWDTINDYLGNCIASINDNTFNNRIQLGGTLSAGGATRYIEVSNGVNYINASFGSTTSNAINNSALTYKNNYFYAAFNSSITANLSSVGLVPVNITQMNIGTDRATTMTGHIKKISYYPVALSSSNLVALTT